MSNQELVQYVEAPKSVEPAVRSVSRFKELPLWKRGITLATLGLSTIAAACSGTAGNETTTTPPTTIETITTTTTEAPSTTTSTTVAKPTTTTEPCPIIESSRKNLWGGVPADLGVIYDFDYPDNTYRYSLLNAKVLGWGKIDVEDFGNTGETHSVNYVDVGFGNSGEGENCRIVSARIAIGSADFPYSAINLERYDGRDFKLSNFHARYEGITQEILDYIDDLQNRNLDIGFTLSTSLPSSTSCLDVNDPYYSMCIYIAEEFKSVQTNNDLVNALKEFKDTRVFPFDSLDPNAIYFASDLKMINYSDS